MLFMKGELFQCDVCGKHFRGRVYLGEHVMLFKKGVFLQCDVCGKDCRDGDYFKGHMKTVLFVLFLLYWGFRQIFFVMQR